MRPTIEANSDSSLTTLSFSAAAMDKTLIPNDKNLDMKNRRLEEKWKIRTEKRVKGKKKSKLKIGDDLQYKLNSKGSKPVDILGVDDISLLKNTLIAFANDLNKSSMAKLEEFISLQQQSQDKDTKRITEDLEQEMHKLDKREREADEFLKAFDTRSGFVHNRTSEFAKKEKLRMKFAENVVHVIPLVLLVCGLILWVLSNLVYGGGLVVCSMWTVGAVCGGGLVVRSGVDGNEVDGDAVILCCGGVFWPMMSFANKKGKALKFLKLRKPLMPSYLLTKTKLKLQSLAANLGVSTGKKQNIIALSSIWVLM
ncbi:hypothetical protein IFM89_020052 [Coptis chinensis]|uniref:Uncharacterized protein n=1 Tax=Coptis chinensis TaxID=261450 RepID=A0A835IWP0_9MAGN|nr:hypothetical protein IFM89_020052 [Coptis chinensis]